MVTTSRKPAAAKRMSAPPPSAKRAPPSGVTAAPKPPLQPKAKQKATLKASADAPAALGKADLKLVRDSFTIPAIDIARIDQLKRRTLALGRATKKSELLRAGLHALQALSDAELTAVLSGLAVLKTGRPKKSAG